MPPLFARLALLCLALLLLTPACTLADTDDDAAPENVGTVEQAVTYYTTETAASTQSSCFQRGTCAVFNPASYSWRDFDCTNGAGDPRARGTCTYQTSSGAAVRVSNDFLAGSDSSTSAVLWAPCARMRLTTPRFGPTATASECYLSPTIFGFPDSAAAGYREMWARPNQSGRIFAHHRLGNEAGCLWELTTWADAGHCAWFSGPYAGID